MRREYLLIFMFIGICFVNSGCGVYMAAHQPSEKNLRLLVVGTPRDVIIAEFGAPVNTEEKDGEKTDIYRFRQGYSQGNKVARTVAHGAADVLTLGLWEVVATPTEATFTGKDIAVKVAYDKDNKAKEITYLAQK